MASQAKRLSRVDFYRLCNELQNQREFVMKECHHNADIVKFAKDRLKIVMAESSVFEVLETVDIKLDKSKLYGSKHPMKGIHATTVRAVMALYEKLGETPPEDFVTLAAGYGVTQQATSAPTAQKAAAQPTTQTEARPIPLSHVRDPKLIPIVNPNHK